jgi:alkylated DNA repair dioxygenase AlkB
MLIPNVPVEYFKDFAFDEAGRVVWMPEVTRDNVIAHLGTLDWADRTPTRMEYFVADIDGAYTYGEGVGERTYEQQEWTPFLRGAQVAVQDFYSTQFEVLFLNRYMNERNWLGWHADNSPIMDHTRPIALITFGAEREIHFAPYEDKKDVTSLKLEHGSLCLMQPGMQISHVHRIPKAGFQCGERVSFTFRGYVPPEPKA